MSFRRWVFEWKRERQHLHLDIKFQFRFHLKRHHVITSHFISLSPQKAKKELEKPNPFLGEVTLVQQTLDWCKEKLGLDKEKVEEEKKELSHVNPEGSMILVSKKDRGKEFFLFGF